MSECRTSVNGNAAQSHEIMTDSNLHTPGIAWSTCGEKQERELLAFLRSPFELVRYIRNSTKKNLKITKIAS